MSISTILRRAAGATAIALLAAACGGGSATDTTDSNTDATEPTVVAESATDTEAPATSSVEAAMSDGIEIPADRPCEGGAFPDDDEFRGRLCDILWLQGQIMRSGGTMDPDWIQEQADATLMYADDRDGAIAALDALIADMAGKVGGDAPSSDDSATIDDVEDLQAQTADLGSCSSELGQLIIDARLNGIDVTDVQEWEDRANAAAALAESGDLAGATAEVCALRDDVAAVVN